MSNVGAGVPYLVDGVPYLIDGVRWYPDVPDHRDYMFCCLCNTELPADKGVRHVQRHLTEWSKEVSKDLLRREDLVSALHLVTSLPKALVRHEILSFLHEYRCRLCHQDFPTLSLFEWSPVWREKRTLFVSRVAQVTEQAPLKHVALQAVHNKYFCEPVNSAPENQHTYGSTTVLVQVGLSLLLILVALLHVLEKFPGANQQ